MVSSQERLVESEHLSQASNLTEALQLAGHRLPAGNVFVVGGSRLFEEGLVSCRYVYESLLAQDIPCDVFAPKHNFPCHFVSKTFHENGIRYDHRLYANPSQHSLAAPLPFGVPEHE